MSKSGRILLRQKIAPVLFPFLLSTLSCSNSTPAATTVEDSAGVRITHNPPLSETASTGWTVSERPLFTIGAREGDEPYMLHQVFDAVRLDNGTVALVNGGTNEIRFFNGNGKHLRTVGGSGGGPGEFKILGRLFAYRGDSLLAYDLQRRATVFATDGTYGRSFRLSNGPAPWGLLVPIGSFSDGSVVVRPEGSHHVTMARRPPQLRENHTYRDTLVMLRYSEQGEYIDEMGRYPGDEYYYYHSKEVTIPRSRLVSPRSAFVQVHDAHVYLGANESYELDVYDVNGALSQSVRRQHSPLPFDEGDYSVLKGRYDSIDGAWHPSAYAEVFATLPKPDYLTAYDNMIVDAEGNCWVREVLDLFGGGTLWSVFASDGAVVGTVAMPQLAFDHLRDYRFGRIMQIGSDFVLVHRTDELDVEYIDLYGLNKER